MAEPPSDPEDRRVTSPERLSSRSGAPQTVLEPDSVVGGYRLLTAIGAGGMGRVFLAHDEKLDRKVALKVLPPEDADEEGRARFLREARALARVDHPNVVHVFASGIDGHIAWMALEYIEGDPLCDVLAEGPFDEETALSLAAQAARGLAAVHAVGVVHRDIKPDNLLLDDEGVLRVVDFGVAQFEEPGGRGGFTTRNGIAIGTPHYMAPEQARGGRVDHRADAWALGATLYALLTGKPPFYGSAEESDLDVLARVINEPVPSVKKRARVSRGAAEMIARLLERDVERRLADLLDIADRLDDLADESMRRSLGELEPEPDDDAGAAAALVEEPPPAVVVAPPPADVLRVRTVDELPGRRRTIYDEPPARPSWAARIAVVAGFGALLGAAVLVVVRGHDGPRGQVAPPLPLVEEAPARPAAPDDDIDPRALALPALRARAATEREPTDEALADPAARVAALERDARGQGAAAAAALQQLVVDETELARGAVARLVLDGGAAGAAAIEAIVAERALAHVPALEEALFRGDKARALAVIAALEALRDVQALNLLLRASKEHPDVKVRGAAFRASRTMFSVEE